MGPLKRGNIKKSNYKTVGQSLGPSFGQMNGHEEGDDGWSVAVMQLVVVGGGAHFSHLQIIRHNLANNTFRDA